ncbi:MAG: DUF3865 domain-containing protein [Candidatus Obscuribacterales bacterium]|nr:DUF3865 domain-containing protein [Candidatus Obscuribacterales bacterium]
MMTANKPKSSELLATSLRNLDRSLSKDHSSISMLANPVIQKCIAKTVSAAHLEKVLVQYCFLPEQIVELLELACNRVSEWKYIKVELERNIAEELGSRTNDVSHYDILLQTLKSDAGLDNSNSIALAATNIFLDSIKKCMKENSPAYALGCAYGLEASAVPELSMVATIINNYAYLQGANQPLIDLANHKSVAKSAGTTYNLNQFFAVHLADFEVGHKNGLGEAISLQLELNEINLQELEAGFEHVLTEMDSWWNALAVC